MFMRVHGRFGGSLPPSPGTPGEGQGGGSPSLPLPRSTGGGSKVWCMRIALLAILTCGICPAQEPATLPSEPSKLAKEMSRQLADLASPDADVRESARERLMQLRREDLPELRRRVDAAKPLAPAQAAALRQIVREVYLAGEDYDKEPGHGFLGIMGGGPDYRGRADVGQPDDGSSPAGVVVFDRIPGFCASRTLLDGDMILGTTEPKQAFNTFEELRQTVGVLAPGTTVHLQVLRRGKLIDVPLTLDVKPIAAEADAGWAVQELRDRRAAKFSEYWRRTFAPLMSRQGEIAGKPDMRAGVSKSE